MTLRASSNPPETREQDAPDLKVLLELFSVEELISMFSENETKKGKSIQRLNYRSRLSNILNFFELDIEFLLINANLSVEEMVRNCSKNLPEHRKKDYSYPNAERYLLQFLRKLKTLSGNDTFRLRFLVRTLGFKPSVNFFGDIRDLLKNLLTTFPTPEDRPPPQQDFTATENPTREEALLAIIEGLRETLGTVSEEMEEVRHERNKLLREKAAMKKKTRRSSE